MKNVITILTGGFAKGWRTRILAALLGVNWIAGYLIGDLTFLDLLRQNWQELAIALGLLAASEHEVAKPVPEPAPAPKPAPKPERKKEWPPKRRHKQ